MRNLILIMASLSMLLFGCDDTKKKTESKPDVVDVQSDDSVDSADAVTATDATSTPDSVSGIDDVVPQG